MADEDKRLTNVERTFVFVLPIVALVAAGIAMFRGLAPPAAPTTVPPQIVDVTTQSGNCTATPQHPYLILSENPTMYFNSADGNTYWIEFGTTTCVDPNNPPLGVNVVPVPGVGTKIPGYSLALPVTSAVEQDMPYIICNNNAAKCSNGSGYYGMHVKP